MREFEVGELADEPLVRAARELSDETAGKDVKAICDEIGLDVNKLVYLAEQRALRAVFMHLGVNLDMPSVSMLALTPEQKTLLPIFTIAYMDGISIGWRGHQIAEGTLRRQNHLMRRGLEEIRDHSHEFETGRPPVTIATETLVRIDKGGDDDAEGS